MNQGLNKGCRCPACGREVYSRRRPACEFCGELLPVELQLTAEERKAIDREICEIKERREEDKKEEELARQRDRRRRHTRSFRWPER